MPGVNAFRWLELRTTDVAGAARFYAKVLGARAHEGDAGSSTLERTTPQGDVALVRDPWGAVVALTSRDETTAPGSVAWHELHTSDVAGAWSLYAELGRWEPGPVWERAEHGVYQTFVLPGERAPMGGIVASALAPQIHPHWAFYFDVAELEVSLAAVQNHGGRVVADWLSVSEARDGSRARVAYCEDPQGAAFGLSQPLER